MKYYAKVCAVLLLFTFLLPTLAACHGRAGLDPFVIPETFDENEQYEILFWAKNDTNLNQTRVYEKAIADFETLYPNIKVNLRLYTDYSRIYNDVITNISTLTTPNVCITYPDHIATYMTGTNIVVPLDELFCDPKYGLGGSELKYDGPTYDELIPQFIGECEINGTHYAIPYMRSTEACYVNKTFVEKLGYTLPETLTWDFIWEVSEAATAKDADGNFIVNGQKVMLPFIYKSTDNMMISMLRQLEAGYSTSEGDIEIFNEVTEELLLEVASHAATEAFTTFKISSYPANFLNAGQCIFAIDSTAGATWMGTDAPLSDISEENLVRFETEVMTIPQFDTANPKMISQGPSVCVFNKADSGEVLASWLFAQFLLTNDVQIGYAKTEGYVPVTSKAHESAEYIDYMSRSGEDNDMYYSVKIDASKLLLDNVQYTFTTPVFNGSASLRTAAGQLIEEVTKAVRRHKTVDGEFISALYDDVTSLYRLDSIASGQGGVSGEKDLGPLPAASVGLIVVLCAVWAMIGIYFIQYLIKSHKNSR